MKKEEKDRGKCRERECEGSVREKGERKDGGKGRENQMEKKGIMEGKIEEKVERIKREKTGIREGKMEEQVEEIKKKQG